MERPPELNGRDVLKGAAGLAVIGAGAAATGRDLVAGARAAGRRRERVAIVGAGAGGVAAAHFLAGTHQVELFEARGRIGGHCDSRTVEHKGSRVTVDLGAQFFHPDTHPIYVTLLEEIGLYDPEHPEADETIESPGSLCVFPVGGGPPLFSSANPLRTLPRALDFATFTQLARQAVLTGLPWKTSVGGWIGSLPVQQAFKDEVLAPWITATIGASRADAMRSSARAILQTFALALRPTSPAPPPRSPRGSASRATCSGCSTAARRSSCICARPSAASSASGAPGSCARRTGDAVPSTASCSTRRRVSGASCCAPCRRSRRRPRCSATTATSTRAS